MTNLKEIEKEIERREKEVECLRELHAVAAKLTALYGPVTNGNGNGNGNGKSKSKQVYPKPGTYKFKVYASKDTIINRVRHALSKHGPMQLSHLAVTVKAPRPSVARAVYNHTTEFKNVGPRTWAIRNKKAGM